MKKWVRTASVLLAILLVMPSAVFAAESTGSAPDYGSRESWAYYEQGEDTGVDVFLICPTVDTRSETNSFDLNEKLKAKFVNALDMEKGIYEEAGRMFSPYYRQMSMNAYKLTETERSAAQEIAYEDVSAAFRWYLDHENGGRGLILAGFSQGSQMCLELMKEYYGGDGAEAKALRENLVAVYALGWSVTEDVTAAYPQIVPAAGETDTGVVVSFDCEDGTLTDTLVIPAGARALSINPLNWRTDGAKADRSLNLGAVMSTGAEPIPALCGAYIGKRGELVVTDVTAEEYPAVIDIFPDGSYHIYDYMFFFDNLRENVSVRTNAWRTGLPFRDVADGAWYEDAVRYVCDQGLMIGTGDTQFDPDGKLNRAQLVTILWRCAGKPVVDGGASFADVSSDAWYADAVRWATAEQIVARVGGFGPDDILTREEAVAMMWNYAKSVGADVSVGEETNILSYDDAFDITEGFASAMQWAVGSGLITGTDTFHLSPLGQLTRAQTATILMRLPGALRVGQPLNLWTGDAKARTELIGYMAAITDENSADYIPASARIAVFDLDGTLFCETDPNYFDYTLLKYRVLEDPDYKDKASDFEKEVAGKIKEQNETGKSFSGLEVDHGKAVASAFAGMTVTEFNEYIQKFKQQAMPSYTGMLRGDGWYLPMLQVVNYLQENDFTVYIVSGTDRLIVRGIVDNSPLNIPNRQIIGSDELIVSSNQGDTDGLNYVFRDGDELILGGEFLIKNLKMNKVAVIMQEIGQQPVLSFGNSTGDSSMAEYVTYNNPYRSLAFMLCCDDTVRENGSETKAQKMFELCEEFDWVPVSMKNDWTTIYGDGVTYLPGADALTAIKARGVLRVGTAGDYQPMSYLDPATGRYVGFDAELAEDLADALGVKLEYVPTSWPTLMEDTLAGKFDLAICGITITEARQKQALMSVGYLGNGKTVLCRAEDADKYTSLEAINRPEVRVMENPGGLNEKFARDNLPNATLIIHDVNQEIPGLIAAGEADVMITEILEAGFYVGQDSRLAAPLIYEPFTQGQLGILMPKGSETLLSYVNTFLAKEKASGRIDALAEEYIYRYIAAEEQLQPAA